MFRASSDDEIRTYEVLSSILGDRDKAYYALSLLSGDYLPHSSRRVAELTGRREEDVMEAWREIRSSFDRERIDFSVIGESSNAFPRTNCPSHVHYIYYAGNLDLLKGQYVTFLGMPSASLQGKSDMAKAVETAVEDDVAVLAPLDPGLSAMALAYALKLGGKAIAVSSSFLSKCPSEKLLPLMESLYEKGLMLTPFPPSMKSERWHVVLRNRFIASISWSLFLPEEKDGGPSWAIADPALSAGAKVMIPSAAIGNPQYTWCAKRADKALVFRKGGDIRKLYGRRRPERDLAPDLFS